MDTITLHGKVYERSSVVAKRHGYTADYLGQLSRANKVDAELVGRSWYVHSDSVQAYKDSLEDDTDTDTRSSAAGNGTPTKENSASETKDDETFSVSVHRGRPGVSPSSAQSEVPQNESKKDLNESSRKGEISVVNKLSRASEYQKSPAPESPQANSRPRTYQSTDRPPRRPVVDTRVAPHESYQRWKQAAYAPDDTELVPHVQKSHEVPPPTAFTDPTASDIRVHSNSDQYSIVTSELPSVRLRGEIPLQGADTDDEMDDTYSEAAVSVQKDIAAYRSRTTSSQTSPAPAQTPARSPAPAEATDTEPYVADGDEVTETGSYWSYVGVAIGSLILGLTVGFIVLGQAVVSYDPERDTLETSWSIQDPSSVVEHYRATRD